jgi:hypothetical protein
MLRAVSAARIGGWGRRFLAALLAAGLAAALGCDADFETAMAQRESAQKLVADLRLALHRSAEAAQRAVMADGDEAAAEAAREAEEATREVERDLEALGPILTRLRFGDEQRLLQEFAKSFAESREVDRTLLGLAVENTNAKAQRLAFGPAREAADAFRDRLADAVRSARAPDATRAELLAARALLGVREIQALQAPHIAEAEDAAMTRLEQAMAASEAEARRSLAELAKLLGPPGREALGAASAELDRFAEAQKQILALSRENSDVRSLAVVLGTKRRVTAACDAAIAAVEESLAKHGWRATR